MRLPLIFFSFFLILGCSPNNVTEDPSLKKHFDKHNLKGSFGLFDNSQGKFTIYNLSRYKDSAYLPASTFKILNSLIAIETGVIRDDSIVIDWERASSSNPICNESLTMRKAFQMSCVPWYQQLALHIGKDTMKKWIDSVGYFQSGTKFQINRLDTFWLDNSLKVAPDQQLGLVKRLYFMQLPFQQRSQRIVKSMMLIEDNSNYKLSYKTGLGYDEDGHPHGWVIGWIEENKHPYFFVLEVESDDPKAEIPKPRMEIFRAILDEYGFFKGRK